MRLSQRFPADLLAETLRVAARCDFSLDELSYQCPDEVVPEGGAKTCTVAVEKEGGQQTVTAFDCQEAGSSAEESSS